MKEKKSRVAPIKDISGQRFGNLVAIELSHINRHLRYWKCECDCGNEKITPIQMLESGRCTHCGCSTPEEPLERKHWRWAKGRTRSNVPSTRKNYKDKGITMWEGWFDNYEAFFEHIGPIPDPTWHLDRINGTIGYFPGNVRWVPIHDGSRNKWNNRYIEIDGVLYCVTDAAAMFNLPRTTLQKRMETNPNGTVEEWLAPQKRGREWTLTIDGVTKPLTAWAKDRGLDPRAVRRRKDRGDTDEEALRPKESHWSRQPRNK